jgi:hypothetical protein
MRFTALAICLLLSPSLFAKDLTHRLGVGYSKSLSIGIPSIAVNYYPNQKTMLGASVGIDTTEDESKFGFAFKAFRNIFEEENLNFQMGGSAALISEEVAGKSESGFELNALMGVEFFFTGLDSLAFRFEAGIGIVSIDDGTTFRTIGDSPLEAGVVFYF